MLTDRHIRTMSSINSIDALLEFLRDELQWPLDWTSIDDVTFKYEPEELGLKPEFAPQVRKIFQVRPMTAGQPWGIFFIDFENKKLPVTLMRRILNSLVIKKRAISTGSAWDAGDLLFMTTYGEEAGGMREAAFAHFHANAGDLPTLNVLQWDAEDTPAKLQDTYHKLKANLGWPPDTNDKDAWRAQWRRPFKHRIGHVIRTASGLAEKLAELSKAIRDRCKEVLEAETESGPMTKLYKAFQSALIHDLKPEDFADTFAQTVAYGLLTAAFSRTDWEGGAHGTAITAEDLSTLVPITNPFLKEILETFLDVGGRKKGGIDFDELGVQDVVELLRGGETDLPAVRNDFMNRKPGEDPVIHFYEHYLAAYNKELKVKRGVFYTPQPVVSYIVRSVHELLQTEFGIEDGLASTITWAEMAAKNPEIAIPAGTPADSPFVVVLDPATGTATFLVEVIDVIWKHLRSKWDSDRTEATALLRTVIPPRTFEEFWNAYVPDHLLPRLYGYELMMAPYAIAHMKVGLKLGETGYKFGIEKRVRIFLTNALEPANEIQARLALDWEALAHEAQAVRAVKAAQRFTVIVGNPPYSKLSANLGPTERALIDPYRIVDGVRIRERGALALEMNLQDDYVKFIRIAQIITVAAGVGIVGFVTNHGYIATPTLRGLRWSLLNSHASIHVLDLHGHSGKGERTPEGGVDQNVFEIQQGVAILIGSICPSVLNRPLVALHSNLYGTRESKYSILSNSDLRSTIWTRVEPTSPSFFLFPGDRTLREEFDQGIAVHDAFPLSSDGIVTARDGLVIGYTSDEVLERIEKFRDAPGTTNEVCKAFDIAPESMGFDFDESRRALRDEPRLEGHILRIHYRPFDFRFLFYFKGLIQSMRTPVTQQLSIPGNVALAMTRQVNRPQFEHALVTRYMMEKKTVSHDRNTQVHPLIRRQESGGIALFEAPCQPNLTDSILLLRQVRTEINAEDRAWEALRYVYAILYSPEYRRRYFEFLKSEFPRLRPPADADLFDELAALGGELIALHLMESTLLDAPITTFVCGTDPSVVKVAYSDGSVWIDKGHKVGFQGVPEDVWNFHIGGYQVCEKWLKDRGPKKGKPGRVLSAADITHYQRIVVALHETIRIMGEIDEVIETHGGWPGAFQTGTGA